jgi:hypothetical protein
MLYLKYRRFGSTFITYFENEQKRDEFLENLYKTATAIKKG